MYKVGPVWMREFDDNLRNAKRDMKLCCAIHRHQIESKRYVLHEHPWLARSWGLDCIADLEKMPGVERVRLEMRQLGVTSHWHARGGELAPAMKPTGVLTNSPHLRRELSLHSLLDHEHVHLVGGRVAAAQEYPYELSRSCSTEESRRVLHILCILVV